MNGGRSQQAEAYKELILEVKARAAEKVRFHRQAIVFEERRVIRLYHRAIRELGREDGPSADLTPIRAPEEEGKTGNGKDPDNSSPNKTEAKAKLPTEEELAADEPPPMSSQTAAELSRLLGIDANMRGESKQDRIVAFNSHLNKLSGIAFHQLSEPVAQEWIERISRGIEKRRAEASG